MEEVTTTGKTALRKTQKLRTPLSKGASVELQFVRADGVDTWTAGTIVTAHRDGTFTIEYTTQDGKVVKETNVPVERIRIVATEMPEQTSSPAPSKPKSKGKSKTAKLRRSQSQDECKLRLGTYVEVNRENKGEWLSGMVYNRNTTGTKCTYDIEYHNGGTETDVPRSRIQNAKELVEGVKIIANWQDKGKWYHGTIAKITANGNYDIEYADGDKEGNVPIKRIRLAPKLAEAEPAASSEPRPFAVGDKIIGNWQNKGTWYHGTIAKIHSDGTYDIVYQDGDVETGVRISKVRAQPAKAEQAKAEQAQAEQPPLRASGPNDASPQFIEHQTRGDCFAHATSRCISQALRSIGVFENSTIQKKFYAVFLQEIQTKFGCEGGNEMYAFDHILQLLHLCTSKTPTLSADLTGKGNSYHALEKCKGVKHASLQQVLNRGGIDDPAAWAAKLHAVAPYLHVGHERYVDLTKTIPSEATKIALTHRQQPVVGFFMSAPEYEILRAHRGDKPLFSRKTKKVKNCSHGGHAINLYDWTEKGVTFINSWGADWGNEGKFLVSRLSDISCEYTTLGVFHVVFGDDLPEQYRAYLTKYSNQSGRTEFRAEAWGTKTREKKPSKASQKKIVTLDYVFTAKDGVPTLNQGFVHGPGKLELGISSTHAYSANVLELDFEGNFQYGLLHGSGKTDGIDNQSGEFRNGICIRGDKCNARFAIL